MPTNADLGAALRALRREQKRTIEDVALIADVHPTYLSGIERGERNPSWCKLYALATALGVSVAVLAKRAEGEAYIAAHVRQARRKLSERPESAGTPRL
jgi:transcriptional regulator with XRE-family HTH domain